jgi:hypothetical protein
VSLNVCGSVGSIGSANVIIMMLDMRKTKIISLTQCLNAVMRNQMNQEDRPVCVVGGIIVLGTFLIFITLTITSYKYYMNSMRVPALINVHQSKHRHHHFRFHR